MKSGTCFIMTLATTPLLTDLYQLNMIQAYLDQGQTGTAVFEFFVRKLPDRRRFLVAAGLEQALHFLENLRFSPEEIAWLEETGRFSKRLLNTLSDLCFTGDVHAMPEGTIFFENEPILRVTAPLPQAQLVETRLINILHFQSLIASKAARMSLLARGKQLVDFGLRRAHGAEAGLMAARASYIGGFAGTATLLANKEFGIPVHGTMAHSFVQSFDSEAAAFEAFAHSLPDKLILLIDTYDTEAAARTIVALAPRLKAEGITIHGVRIDSGDLAALSKKVRRILDDGGLHEAIIFVSGGLDEEELAALAKEDIPIDGFGVGTSLVTSFDVPALDCAYKLQEYAGIARRKWSPGKATWPGRKQVRRHYGPDGAMIGDQLTLDGEDLPGQCLIEPVMVGGRRIGSSLLREAKERAAQGLKSLPAALKDLTPGASYPVAISSGVRDLAAEVDRRLTHHA